MHPEVNATVYTIANVTFKMIQEEDDYERKDQRIEGAEVIDWSGENPIIIYNITQNISD